jgi:general secretion pathway protein E
MVDWLCSDGMISPEEAQRTIARCSQAESAQHPLVRLAAPCRFV